MVVVGGGSVYECLKEVFVVKAFFIISFVKRVDVVYVFVFFLLELMYHGGEMDTK